MRLVTFEKDGAARLGAQVGEHIIDLPGAYEARLAANGTSDSALIPTTMLDFLQAGTPVLESANETLGFAADEDNLATLKKEGLVFQASRATFLPPVPRPGKMLCLGQNYRAHVEEMGLDLPDYPNVFTKFATSLVGHRQPIVYPTVSEMVDFEAELAVVIGRTARYVALEDAFNYVAGYTIFNDVTVRDYQRRTSQFLLGKNFDRSSPVGPALVTADEIDDPHALDLSLRLNGGTMQHSSTNDLVFDVPFVIHYLSQIMVLEPGDIIATGTPGGVGFARDPKVFLKPGDVVQVEIEGLGILENEVVDLR